MNTNHSLILTTAVQIDEMHARNMPRSTHSNQSRKRGLVWSLIRLYRKSGNLTRQHKRLWAYKFRATMNPYASLPVLQNLVTSSNPGWLKIKSSAIRVSSTFMGLVDTKRTRGLRSKTGQEITTNPSSVRWVIPQRKWKPIGPCSLRIAWSSQLN